MNPIDSKGMIGRFDSTGVTNSLSTDSLNCMVLFSTYLFLQITDEPEHRFKQVKGFDVSFLAGGKYSHLFLVYTLP